MDIHLANKPSSSWKVVYVINCFFGLLEGGTDEQNVVCCAMEQLMPALHRTMCE